MSEITLIIDNFVVESYKKHYFKKYPKRKVFPIEKPIPPSLNDWSIMPRFKANNCKQAWKEFIVWAVRTFELNDLKIRKCDIHTKFVFNNKRRHDSDNLTPKFIFDGFVDAGLLIDDDFEHVESLTISSGYDKSNPRVEIYITGDFNNGR